MSWWMAAGGPSWLIGSSICGKAVEGSSASLETGTVPIFPTNDQADAIEGYRQVGPC